MRAYFALAEELDVPVGIHTGTSLPGTPFAGYPRFRVALGNPLLLEDLLVRRPRLRVFLMFYNNAARFLRLDHPEAR